MSWFLECVGFPAGRCLAENSRTMSRWVELLIRFVAPLSRFTLSRKSVALIGALLNSTWNNNSRETTTCECPNYNNCMPTAARWRLLQNLITTAKCNDREMTSLKLNMQSPPGLHEILRRFMAVVISSALGSLWSMVLMYRIPIALYSPNCKGPLANFSCLCTHHRSLFEGAGCIWAKSCRFVIFPVLCLLALGAHCSQVLAFTCIWGAHKWQWHFRRVFPASGLLGTPKCCKIRQSAKWQIDPVSPSRQGWADLKKRVLHNRLCPLAPRVSR